MRPRYYLGFVGLSLLLVGLTSSQASWCQLGVSTKDKFVRKLADDDSANVLEAVSKLHAAFAAIDRENWKEAGGIGKAAADQLAAAAIELKKLGGYFRENAAASREVTDTLHRVDFDARARLLFEKRGAQCIWQEVAAIARQGGADALYREAGGRIEDLAKQAGEFFGPIQESGERGYKPIAGAQLLRLAGEDIEFGACVSALFIDEHALRKLPKRGAEE